VADGHVAHDEGEGDPWHVGTRTEVFGDAVGANGADKEGEGAVPEVEESDEVEGRDAAAAPWPASVGGSGTQTHAGGHS
jgi:hypothetical protein